MKAVILDQKTLQCDALDLGYLEQTLPDCARYDATAPQDVVDHIGDAEIVLTNKVVLNRDVLAQTTNLKMIAVLATGYNNIDLGAAQEFGVTVCNARSYSTPSVLQHSFMLIFTLLSNFRGYTNLVREGAWERSPQFCLLNYKINEVAGKTIGIVGYGELGQAMADAAKAFGMKVLIAERKGATDIRDGRADFETVLTESDVLSLHCPLTPETQNMIGAGELEKMKPSAILINVARGGVVHEESLVKALKRNKIAGAGVDVLTQEPPSQGNPLLDPSIPNLIVTPHIAWASIEAQQRLLDIAVDNVAAFMAGNPVNVVV